MRDASDNNPKKEETIKTGTPVTPNTGYHKGDEVDLFLGGGAKNPFAERQELVFDHLVTVTKSVLENHKGIRMFPMSKADFDIGMDSMWFETTIRGVAFVVYLGLTNTCYTLNDKVLTRGNRTLSIRQYPQDAIKDKKSQEVLRSEAHKFIGTNKKVVQAPDIYMDIQPSDDPDAFRQRVQFIIKAVFDSLVMTVNREISGDKAGLYADSPMAKRYANSVLSREVLSDGNSEKAVSINITHERRPGMIMQDGNGLVYNPDIIFTSAVFKNENERIVNPERDQTIRVGVSADVMWSDIPQSDNNGNLENGATLPGQVYTPVFNIQAIKTNTITPSNLLWSLMTATAPLLTDNAYLYPYMVEKNEMRSAISKMNHFGAAGAEHAEMHKDPTKTAGHVISDVLTLPEDQKLSVLHNIMRTKPAFFMAISPLQSDYGFTAWIEKAAHTLTHGGYSLDKSRQVNYDFLYREAVRMCGDSFTEQTVFKYGDPIAVDTGSLMPLGTFEDKEGVQNLSCLTHFVLLSMFSGNPEGLASVQEYNRYMYAHSPGDAEVRMQHAINYLRDLPSATISNVNVVGHARRFEINPDFITALTNSYAKSGVNINTPKIGYMVNNNQSRVVYNSAFRNSSYGSLQVNRGNTNANWEGGGISNGFSLFS